MCFLVRFLVGLWGHNLSNGKSLTYLKECNNAAQKGTIVCLFAVSLLEHERHTRVENLSEFELRLDWLILFSFTGLGLSLNPKPVFILLPHLDFLTQQPLNKALNTVHAF